MKGQVVLVTGANGGLGTYVTQAFVDAGATVIGTSRKIQQSDFDNPNFTAIAAEISTREGAKGLVDQVVARFGKPDVLAHTVGGFAGGQLIADTDNATFQRMFDLNLNCVFHILRGDGSTFAPDGRRPHHCDWKPGRAGIWRGRGRVQRFEGCHGLLNQNCGTRKQRRWTDCKRNLALGRWIHQLTAKRFRTLMSASGCSRPRSRSW